MQTDHGQTGKLVFIEVLVPWQDRITFVCLLNLFLIIFVCFLRLVQTLLRLILNFLLICDLNFVACFLLSYFLKQVIQKLTSLFEKDHFSFLIKILILFFLIIFINQVIFPILNHHIYLRLNCIFLESLSKILNLYDWLKKLIQTYFFLFSFLQNLICSLVVNFFLKASYLSHLYHHLAIKGAQLYSHSTKYLTNS